MVLHAEGSNQAADSADAARLKAEREKEYATQWLKKARKRSERYERKLKRLRTEALPRTSRRPCRHLKEDHDLILVLDKIFSQKVARSLR